MKENIFKVATTAIGSLLSSIFGALYVPVGIMVFANITDYISGLCAAKKRGDGVISSYRSIQGIKKKVAMWLLVVVGAIIDQLLEYVSAALGFDLPFTFLVAAVVAVWITCNEIISILENVMDTGVTPPAFMIPLVKNIRTYAEKAVGTESGGSGENDESEENDEREEKNHEL